MTFDVVVGKLREYYANGVTSIRALRQRIRDFIARWSPINKRSIDASSKMKLFLRYSVCESSTNDYSSLLLSNKFSKLFEFDLSLALVKFTMVTNSCLYR